MWELTFYGIWYFNGFIYEIYRFIPYTYKISLTFIDITDNL